MSQLFLWFSTTIFNEYIYHATTTYISYWSKGGCGLPRQKLLSVHVALRNMVVFEFSVNCCMSGRKAPDANTISRHSAESPAIFPSAQTACSRTSSFVDKSSWQKIGTAPCWMTVRVSSDVPDAMFVKAHAASNCNVGFSSRFNSSTKTGTTPSWMTSRIGGFFSIESNFRNFITALSCCRGSWLWRSMHKEGNSAIYIHINANHKGYVHPYLNSGILRTGWTDRHAHVICLQRKDKSKSYNSHIEYRNCTQWYQRTGSGMRRRCLSCSSRLLFRIWMVVSSRLWRCSDASMPFLNWFFLSCVAITVLLRYNINARRRIDKICRGCVLLSQKGESG